MFKYLIIWNILALFIIGTESKAVTKSCYDFGYDIPYEPTGREKIGDLRRPFYRLILKCAEDIANEMMPQEGPLSLKKNCMELDMVDYCANLYKVEENVDCKIVIDQGGMKSVSKLPHIPMTSPKFKFPTPPTVNQRFYYVNWVCPPKASE